jgi:hypothetical protein
MRHFFPISYNKEMKNDEDVLVVFHFFIYFLKPNRKVARINNNHIKGGVLCYENY